MATLDWIVLAVLAASVLLGLWRGLVYEVLSVLNWIAAFVLAQWLAPRAAQALPLGHAGESLRYAAGFLAVFIGALFAGGLVAWLVRRLVEAGWPKGTLMNVNFPGCPAAEVKGVAVVPQGKYDLQSTEIEERIDARQRAYYWIGLRRRKSAPPEDSDLGAVYGNFIAVTPLHLNLTEDAALTALRQRLSKG